MSENFDPYHKWLGIPPAQQPADHYRLLGLAPFENDADVIETAANQRMSYLREISAGQHGKLSQSLLNELSAARRCLLDPHKKAAYDGELRSKQTPAAPSAPPTAMSVAAPIATPVAAPIATVAVTPTAPPVAPVAMPVFVPATPPVAAPIAPPIVAPPVAVPPAARPVAPPAPPANAQAPASPPASLPPAAVTARRKWMLIGNLATALLLVGYLVYRNTGAPKPAPRPKTPAKADQQPRLTQSLAAKPVTPTPAAAAGPVKKQVRFIRIELPQKGTLTLSEVEVFLDGRNIATYGSATQSSVSNGGDAARAIDGNTSGKYGDGSSTHTEESEKPWWRLDLGKSYPVDTIVVYNRIDPGTEQRLNGFTLMALDDVGRTVLELKDQPAPMNRSEFVVNEGGPKLTPTKPKPKPPVSKKPSK